MSRQDVLFDSAIRSFKSEQPPLLIPTSPRSYVEDLSYSASLICSDSTLLIHPPATAPGAPFLNKEKGRMRRGQDFL